MRACRAGVAAISVLSLLCACGPQSHLKLNLRTVAVTVPRLIAPALELVPPSSPPPLALPPVPSVVNQLPPAVRPSTSAPPRPAVCPPAPPLAVPKAAATETVDRPPVGQSFVQRSTGTFTAGATKGLLNNPVQVTVTDLPATTTGSGQQVIPWRVQQVDTVTDARSVEVYELVQPSSAAGASSPGVYLVGLAWSDPVRGELSFQPSGNGLFVLPSPVEVAQNDTQYVGLATDPNTLTTLRLTRNVRARKRVDACGQLIDTWTVEMSGTLVTPSSQWNVTWNQQLATAYGAVDVDELLTLDDVKGGLSWARRLVSMTVPQETR